MTFSTVSSSAFAGTAITSIELPQTCKTIGGAIYEEDLIGAFQYCIYLEHVNLAQTKRIEEDAFAECYNMSTITIPSSVECIGRRAFQCNPYESAFFEKMLHINVNPLTTVTFENSDPNWMLYYEYQSEPISGLNYDWCGCSSDAGTTVTTIRLTDQKTIDDYMDWFFNHRCEELIWPAQMKFVPIEPSNDNNGETSLGLTLGLGIGLGVSLVGVIIGWILYSVQVNKDKTKKAN